MSPPHGFPWILIVHAFRRGESPETIRQNFELLSLEEVYGATAFYLASQADIDATWLAKTTSGSKEGATLNRCKRTCVRDSRARGRK